MNNSGVFIILFDLPTKTKTQIKLANRFRKELKKNGYFMLQESVATILSVDLFIILTCYFAHKTIKENENE